MGKRDRPTYEEENAAARKSGQGGMMGKGALGQFHSPRVNRREQDMHALMNVAVEGSSHFILVR